ncbi:hypothetical protein LTR10_018814 [Elasticomyces elasticus]|uniref:MAGE domain-containing protein n=1 Tax=Exophiala sideris TaxID=1016849 RepID=A0ABR0J8B5_9EURO|nr:hypothetical protein LTR10_018814 [Elasticomyces elasticus]KAK5029941.1 hypothetical protein LTS07_005665 [Exophiala sideris]KAK5031619.1 hypothetical protein LTR13_007608 [Exophiala sideris]KAK5058297.1 hypothetical protein LTR69_006701 [Exophiala sideris]KAK5180226.1 hypothetical protein LTR44_007351 [Eurotiomycetes sp. CCFEE 6388]
MPLKRRSDAISRDQSDAESEDVQTQTQRRRQRSSSASSLQSSASSIGSEGGTQNQEQTLTKKLVRLALSTEYSRTPLRRSDISTKVFKESNASGRGFRAVFEGAQRILQDTFGMQLVELPSKEKTALKDRRNQATQTKAPSGSSSKSWILISILPAELKTNPAIAQPSRAPTVETEASYIALYTFILSLIYLNNNSLTDQKLNRYLKRVNADTYTPFGSLDKLLQRLIREGYIEKRRDTSSGEEVIEWVPGPRGKVEVGMRGVTGLVRSVYGWGAVGLSKGRTGSDDEGNGGRLVKIEEHELNAKLSRSLGIKVGEKTQRDLEQDADEGDVAEGDQASSRQRQGQSTRGRGRRARDDDDD